MNDKNNFLIPAVTFTVAVSIVGGFLAARGANQLTSSGLIATSAQIYGSGGLAVGTGAPMGADGTISTTGAINTAGGVILNTAGATNGLLIPNGAVGIGTMAPGAKLLDINDTSSAGGTTPLVRIQSSSTLGPDYLFQVKTGASTALLVSDQGGVSIGDFVAPPSNGLYVAGSAQVGSLNVTGPTMISNGDFVPTVRKYTSTQTAWCTTTWRIDCPQGYIINYWTAPNLLNIASSGGIGNSYVQIGPLCDANPPGRGNSATLTAYCIGHSLF